MTNTTTTSATYISKTSLETIFATEERTLWALTDGSYAVKTWTRLPAGSFKDEGWRNFSTLQSAKTFASRPY